jgi:hypothetical protein
MTDKLHISSSSSFDTSKGFTITNNTVKNVYLQTLSFDFEKIEPANTSTAQMEYGDYPLRADSDTNAAIYLTVEVKESDGSVNVAPGVERGEFVVTANFA